MNDFGAAFAGFHHPLKADRMVFRHGRAHDQNRVGVTKILLRSGGPAASKGGAQTGHGGAVSYTGLVAHAHHARPAVKSFLIR